MSITTYTASGTITEKEGTIAIYVGSDATALQLIAYRGHWFLGYQTGVSLS